jgi:hypothetical protein
MSRVSQAIVAVALVSVAACASKPKEVAVVPPPVVPTVTVYAPPPISPINRGLSQAATVWHMRVALNVAALACRGAQEGAIIQRYNAMLASHKATLATAQTTLSAEFKAGGGDWQDRYDDAMTRLYNFFSQAQARDAFCTAAAATLAEAETLAPAELPAYAAAVLPTLDAPFAEMMLPRPVIAVASSGMGVMQAPLAVAVAPRAPGVTFASVAPRPAPVAAIAPRPVLPAAATRAIAAPAAAPAAPKRVPKLELDLSTLQD